ncbi:MAG: hypothetical protein H8E15_05695 [Planctomycetes bacterium]|nr:hypothetical protein [Planctomycetota bacterium]
MLSWLLILATHNLTPAAPFCALGTASIALINPLFAPQEPGQTEPKNAGTEQQQAQQTPLSTPKKVDSDPQAVALFEKLILAQATEKDLPAVVGFGVNLDIRLFDPSGGNEFALQLFFLSEPIESVRMVIDDSNSGTRIEKGFDADGFWLRDADDQLLALDSHEFEQDRAAIDESMVLCNDFLLLFDLKRLQRKASELALVRADDHTLISGKLKRGREQWGFELFIPKDAQLPTRLSLQPPMPKPAKVAVEAPAGVGQDGKGGSPQGDLGDKAGLPKGDQLETEKSAKQIPIPALPRLHYAFGDWVAYEGRLLPAWIEEFQGEDLQRPLRLMEILDFRWREPQRLQTRR